VDELQKARNWLRNAIRNGNVTYMDNTIYWKYVNKGSPWQKGQRKIITPHTWHGKGYRRIIDKEQDTYDFSGPEHIGTVEYYIEKLGGIIEKSEPKDRIIWKSNNTKQTVYGHEIVFFLSGQIDLDAHTWRVNKLIRDKE